MPALTFTRTSPGTYDPLTDTTSAATVTTVTGEGTVKTKGTEQRYRDLSLVLQNPVTFLFTPDDYALRSSTTDFVQPGDTVAYNGLALTVRYVSPPIGPDGKVIAATIVVSA